MVLRAAGGLILAVVLNLVAILLVALAGTLDVVGAGIAAGVMRIGFLGLGPEATVQSPLRPMRLTLGFGLAEAVMSVILLSALPQSMSILQISVAASLIAAIIAVSVLLVSVDHRPR